LDLTSGDVVTVTVANDYNSTNIIGVNYTIKKIS